MNGYPNVLTPPMDSPEAVTLSPSGSSSSPTNYYTSAVYSQPYKYTSDGEHTTVIHNRGKPYLNIVEQPVDRFRFRYKSEMAGTHGSLTGKNSDRSRKQTFPTVELYNYQKPAVIRCSLYQWGREERKPHPHRLVRKYGNDEMDDPHDLYVGPDQGYSAIFHSMGIIHTAKKFLVSELVRKNIKLKEDDVAKREGRIRPLTKKEELEVKNSCEKEAKSINLNIVCLRFEAFEVINNIYHTICPPVYTHSINNLKSALTGDLKIVRMDHCTSPSRGGREIFLLVEKVTKKNIRVRFFELDDDDNEVWSAYGKFNELDVHHQYAIVLKTPPYRHLDINQSVKVYIELIRPLDRAHSDPKDFTYVPSEFVGRKRARINSSGYASSNCFSDEIPTTINQASNVLINVENRVNSDELNNILKTGKFDSREFKEICDTLLESGPIDSLYEIDLYNSLDLVNALAMDSPHVVSDGSNIDIKPAFRDLKRIHLQKNTGSSMALPSRELNFEEQKVVNRVKEELISFLRSRPASKDRFTGILNYLFTDPAFTTEMGNVLHLLIFENNVKNGFLYFLLRLLLKYHLFNLVNIKNDSGRTPLHIAVEYCYSVIEYLMLAKADVAMQDSFGNTPLHVAVMKNAPNAAISLLLRAGIDSKTYIDSVNYEGHTSLHLAVKSRNLAATQLLCWHGADINAEDKKNGYTPLHIAVADQCVEIVNFFLEYSTDLDYLKTDYRQHTPIKLAKMLVYENKPHSNDVYTSIENFMKLNGTFEEVQIKEEVEELSDPEMETEDIKIEAVPEDLRTNNSKIRGLTDKYLNEVGSLLDKSGHGENLAVLLDLDHLLRANIFPAAAQSKALIEYALKNGESLQTIKSFLENLDEVEGVQIIDKIILLQDES